jgi:hypothetical protein
MHLYRCLAAIALVVPIGVGRPAEPPPTAPHDTKKDVPLASVPLTILEDIPYLEVRVNGSTPLWFNIDSGASGCVIDLAQCKRLGIPTEGQAKGTGAGAGTYDVTYAKDATFTVGTLKTKVDKVMVIDLSGVKIPEDKKLAGLLGYEFFQRYVVVLDYEKGALTVHDPKTFAYRGQGDVIPLTFKKKVPFVKGTIVVPGRPPAANREWLVDTGSGDALNDELLAESTGEKKKVTGGHGLGKEFAVWLTTADRVDLGRFHFAKVSGVSGGMKIGGGLLRHFTVILDYPKQRMILQPNGHYRQ